MTKKEFELLQSIATRGLSTGTTLDEGARLVLINGKQVREAADKVGCHVETLHRKVRRLQQVRENILSFYKLP